MTMNENLKKFYAEISVNKDLQDAFIKLNKEYPDKEQNIPKLIELAAKHGFNITESEINQSLTCTTQVEESDDKSLEQVSGGAIEDFGRISDCFCVVGGGGTGDKIQNTCACVFGGVGTLTDKGKEYASLGFVKGVGSSTNPLAMYCVVEGDGIKWIKCEDTTK